MGNCMSCATQTYPERDVEEKKLLGLGNPMSNKVQNGIRLVAGSCIYQHKQEQPLWRYMLSTEPDLALLLGDNVYLDIKHNEEKCENTKHLKYFNIYYENVEWYKEPIVQYDVLLNHKDFVFATDEYENNKDVPKLLIWDDHDFGIDNADGSFPQKHLTRDGCLYFWEKLNALVKDRQTGNIIKKLRKNEDDGIYWYYDLEKTLNNNERMKIRFYGLDSRWYKNQDGDSMLGDKQKAWLQNLIEISNNDSIHCHIFLCGTTMLTKFKINVPGQEIWPTGDKQWFVKLLNDNDLVKRSLMLSGDIHCSIINEENGLYEIVTSSMTHSIGELAGVCCEAVIDKECCKINVIDHNNFIAFDVYMDGWKVQYIDKRGHILLTATYNFESQQFVVEERNEGHFFKLLFPH